MGQPVPKAERLYCACVPRRLIDRLGKVESTYTLAVWCLRFKKHLLVYQPKDARTSTRTPADYLKTGKISYAGCPRYYECCKEWATLAIALMRYHKYFLDTAPSIDRESIS
jgi:hypothetical protein